MNSSPIQYRPEIDGLRSIAVLPVILFHANFPAFSGGYVGVDVFFVISGYLITSLILKELAAGEFSLVNFYERRARRILPALFFVIFCCLPFAWMWMIPRELLDFGKSVWFVTLFASNFLFWSEAGYFGPDLETSPLIHTWSLAVEEQYYLLFPLLLMACWSLQRRMIAPVIVVIALSSLIWSATITASYPDMAFYLLPTRAWELFAGALCGYWLQFRSVHQLPLSLRTALAACGLLAIGWSIVAFDATTVFPGSAALLPVAGTALVILFSSNTAVASSLALPPLVGLGLISYSAYLWHQPIFAFVRLRFMQEPGTIVFVLLILLTLLLAYFSWRFVEQPFRQRGTWDGTQIFKMAAASSCLLFALGLGLDARSGFPQRMGADYFLNQAVQNSSCLPTPILYVPLEARCVYGNEENIRILLWGDSHANMIADALGNAILPRSIGMMAATYSGCSPVYELINRNRSDYCQQLGLENFQWLAEHDEIEFVVLMARWTLQLEGTRFDNAEGGVESGRPFVLTTAATGTEEVDSEKRKASVAAAMRDYILAIQALGKRVVLVYPVPEAGWDVPALLERRRLLGGQPAEPLSTSAELFVQRNRRAIELFDGLPDSSQLIRIRPEELFCNKDVPGRCIVEDEEGALYADDDHLNDRSAAMLANLIVAEMDL